MLTRYESGTATIAVPDSYESWTGRIWKPPYRHNFTPKETEQQWYDNLLLQAFHAMYQQVGKGRQL